MAHSCRYSNLASASNMFTGMQSLNLLRNAKTNSRNHVLTWEIEEKKTASESWFSTLRNSHKGRCALQGTVKFYTKCQIVRKKLLLWAAQNLL